MSRTILVIAVLMWLSAAMGAFSAMDSYAAPLTALTGMATSSQSFPCPVEVSAGFVVTWCFRAPDYQSHGGMDIWNGRCGDPIRAIAPGVATFWETRPGWSGASVVEIDHGSGWVSRYLHMEDFALRPFEGVQTAAVGHGEVIAHVGTKGMSTACHLHLEILKDGRRLDPWQYACLDIPPVLSPEGMASSGRCAADSVGYNPGSAVTFTDPPPDPGSITVQPGGGGGGPGGPPGPRLELPPHSYAADPSWAAEVDYDIGEYELLQAFVRELALCQEDELGVSHCARPLRDMPSYEALEDQGVTLVYGNCTHRFTLPLLTPLFGVGTYEFCATSSTELPIGDGGIDIRSVKYRFAVRLVDKVPPPAVTGVRAEQVDDGTVEVTWDRNPAEDVRYYRVDINPGPASSTGGTGETFDGLSPGNYRATVTAVDYAGHVSAGDSDGFTIIYVPPPAVPPPPPPGPVPI